MSIAMTEQQKSDFETNGFIRDCPDQTESSNHVTLWDGSNYKRAA